MLVGAVPELRQWLTIGRSHSVLVVSVSQRKLSTTRPEGPPLLFECMCFNVMLRVVMSMGSKIEL